MSYIDHENLNGRGYDYNGRNRQKCYDLFPHLAFYNVDLFDAKSLAD